MKIFELYGDKAKDLLSGGHQGHVEIKKDKFGQVQVAGAKEIEIEDRHVAVETFRSAFLNRKISSTFRNDESSRSHAICEFRVENRKFKEVEDGKIFVIDLAGAEHSSDSRFHGNSQRQESRIINQSLNSLKECARNRSLSFLNPSVFYHVPYRRSKLTLLLKDSLEMESRKIAKTVVICTLAPSCADLNSSLSTLKFVSNIRVSNTKRIGVRIANPDDPGELDE